MQVRRASKSYLESQSCRNTGLINLAAIPSSMRTSCGMDCNTNLMHHMVTLKQLAVLLQSQTWTICTVPHFCC